MVSEAPPALDLVALAVFGGERGLLSWSEGNRGKVG